MAAHLPRAPYPSCDDGSEITNWETGNRRLTVRHASGKTERRQLETQRKETARTASANFGKIKRERGP